MKYMSRIIMLPVALFFMLLEPIILSFVHAMDWLFDAINWWLKKKWEERDDE